MVRLRWPQETKLDYEAKDTYMVTLTAEDSFGEHRDHHGDHHGH